MGSYSAFRVEGFPTLYDENKTPVYNDILIYGLIFCFCILGFSFFVVIPGVRGIQRLYVSVRIFTSLFIGAFILICNFGQEWEISRIRTSTQYKAFTEKEITANIAVKIGLRSVNITLEGTPRNQLNEVINYNERFSWEWAQGRNGFGQQAGRIQREFRAGQIKGLPYPILWIAEYFTFDGEGMRYGRHYRTGGWYSHIMMWLAFSLWLLTNILFCMVIRYGAVFLFLTGSSLLTANILFASIRNAFELKIPFEKETIVMRYGWSFYLTLFTGLLCCILGIIIYWFDISNPDAVCSFFGIELTQNDEDFYADPAEFGGQSSRGTDEATGGQRVNQNQEGMRKRKLTNLFQVPSTRRSRAQTGATPPKLPPKRSIGKADEEEMPYYENFELKRFEPIEEEEIKDAKGGSKEHIVNFDN